MRPNLGQLGLSFDWFDISGGPAREGGHPGCRLAVVGPGEQTPEVLSKQCKAGPTAAMLDLYYNTVVWIQGSALEALHDGTTLGMQANDVALLRDYLGTASPSNRRSLWLNGEGAAEGISTALTNPEASTLLNLDLATLFANGNYGVASGNPATTMVFDPTGTAFHAARLYGLDQSLGSHADVLGVNSAVSGAIEVARYEDQSHRGVGGPGPYVASVFAPFNVPGGRYFATLVDGFNLSRLRGDGAGSSANDAARIAWSDDALAAFGLCARGGPVIAIGDLPGKIGPGIGFVRGGYPNPARGTSAKIEFSLSRPAPVTIRFYDVSGRLVHEAKLEGVAGANRYLWNGTTIAGRAAAGVYFYRLSAPGVRFGNNAQRMVLLGGGE